MLDVIWERKGACVILSRRFSSRIKTLEREQVLCQTGRLATLASSFALELPVYLETICRTEKRMTRGPTATRNHGKTPAIIPTQKNTRMTFWMNISAWNGRRTSTGEITKEQVSDCWDPQTENRSRNLKKQRFHKFCLKFVCCLLSSLIKEKSRNLATLIFLVPRKFK